MRNSIVENPPGVFVLYRDGEKLHGGDSLALPSELEFWQEIESLRDKLVEFGEGIIAMKAGTAVRIGDLEAKIERLQGMVQSRGDEIERLESRVADMADGTRDRLALTGKLAIVASGWTEDDQDVSPADVRDKIGKLVACEQEVRKAARCDDPAMGHWAQALINRTL